MSSENSIKNIFLNQYVGRYVFPFFYLLAKLKPYETPLNGELDVPEFREKFNKFFEADFASEDNTGVVLAEMHAIVDQWIAEGRLKLKDDNSNPGT